MVCLAQSPRSRCKTDDFTISRSHDIYMAGYYTLPEANYFPLTETMVGYIFHNAYVEKVVTWHWSARPEGRKRGAETEKKI